jgi:hypothetical protein
VDLTGKSDYYLTIQVTSDEPINLYIATDEQWHESLENRSYIFYEKALAEDTKNITVRYVPDASGTWWVMVLHGRESERYTVSHVTLKVQETFTKTEHATNWLAIGAGFEVLCLSLAFTVARVFAEAKTKNQKRSLLIFAHFLRLRYIYGLLGNYQ